jgi:uncharacterized protein
VPSSGTRGPDLDLLRSRIASILAKERPVPVASDPSYGELPFARLETPAGPLYRRILRHSPAHRVGRFGVREAFGAERAMLALLALDPAIGECDPRGFLYVDTETTGLAGGTGTVPFLLGMARFEGDGCLVLEQLLLRKLGEETPLLLRFLEETARASCLVSYNGKSFDLPLLRTRLVMNRLPAAPDRPHLDLVHVARRVHGGRLKGCSLISIEDRVLGYERLDDVPSGEVVARYRHFLRTGDDGALLGVVDHNAWDVVALAALVGIYGAPLETLGAHDLVGIARTLRRARSLDRAGDAVEAAVERGAGADGLRERAEIARILGERDRAIADLERVVGEVEDRAARLRLAKLYEHHVRSPSAALAHVAHGTTEGEEAARRRRDRLEKKLVKARAAAPHPAIHATGKRRRKPPS